MRGMIRKNTKLSRLLRINQTDAEKKLWFILRNRQFEGIKFRRQFPVGDFVIDFYSPAYKLGIEADGGQHYNEENQALDIKRTELLSKNGIKLLRFSNHEIFTNFEGVKQTIYDTLNEKSPSP
ncbi:MAG: DUF559 domain-containing protein [Deltaproteobacteria bacterium]|nr:DUF559 domain-containing protein [Deltaproteobacteria bacterium]